MEILVEGLGRYSLQGDGALFSFDYPGIQPRYHAASSSSDTLTLYKGGVRGAQEKGFPSNALVANDLEHLMHAKRIIGSGDATAIEALFDRHTTYYGRTPFLSATLNPQMAQVFASTHPLSLSKRDTTIYEIAVRADRCIVDVFDTGACGASKEILILGAIFPYEFIRMKIINDDHHSELLKTRGAMTYLDPKPPKDSANRSVRDPGNWMRLDRSHLGPGPGSTGNPSRRQRCG